MYNYLDELTMYVGVLYMQPSWYSFSSWPHSEITSLSRSKPCTFLPSPFSQQRNIIITIEIAMEGKELGKHYRNCVLKATEENRK